MVVGKTTSVNQAEVQKFNLDAKSTVEVGKKLLALDEVKSLETFKSLASVSLENDVDIREPILQDAASRPLLENLGERLEILKGSDDAQLVEKLNDPRPEIRHAAETRTIEIIDSGKFDADIPDSFSPQGLASSFKPIFSFLAGKNTTLLDAGLKNDRVQTAIADRLVNGINNGKAEKKLPALSLGLTGNSNISPENRLKVSLAANAKIAQNFSKGEGTKDDLALLSRNLTELLSPQQNVEIILNETSRADEPKPISANALKHLSGINLKKVSPEVAKELNQTILSDLQKGQYKNDPDALRELTQWSDEDVADEALLQGL